MKRNSPISKRNKKMSDIITFHLLQDIIDPATHRKQNSSLMVKVKIKTISWLSWLKLIEGHHHIPAK